MLLELNIKNFAIIDDINISFSKGFNVLTGETGTGKSIIIDAVSLVLGGRAAKEYVKNGQKKATIEALFHLDNPSNINKKLKKYGISIEPDNNLLLTREIHSTGRSLSRINGHTVTLNMLKDLTYFLVDIHGQHEHQSLLKNENHINFIDSLGDKKLHELKIEIHNKYSDLLHFKKRLQELSINEMERERRIDLLKFQLDEINEANLIEGEEVEIENEYNKLSNQEEISYTINQIYSQLSYTDYTESSIIDNLNLIYKEMEKISKYDNKINEHSEVIKTVLYQLEDLTREIRNYKDTIDYDPERLKYLEERIDLFNRLKRKYGNNLNEIIEYRNKISKELNEVVNNEKEIEIINKKINNLEKNLISLSTELSDLRKKIITKFKKDLLKQLDELNMKNVSFEIGHDILEYPTENGIDKIEFLISTNVGEPLKKLSKIVSGGEMSRIMLAFKSILAETDNISTMIFDEIDTGISGRTAQVVGEKITNISRNHQILCITHLPQIAAMSDTHFLITKETNNKNTKTLIKKLNNKEKVDELSRLLGGVNLTNTTRMHAKEMIEMSKKAKKN